MALSVDAIRAEMERVDAVRKAMNSLREEINTRLPDGFDRDAILVKVDEVEGECASPDFEAYPGRAAAAYWSLLHSFSRCLYSRKYTDWILWRPEHPHLDATTHMLPLTYLCIFSSRSHCAQQEAGALHS